MISDILNPKTKAQIDYAVAMSKKLKHKDIAEWYEVWKSSKKES